MIKFFKRNKKNTLKTELSIDENWNIVVDKAIKDYNSLSHSERIWFNIQVLIDSTNGGGLISYYYNSGADHVYDAIENLDFLMMDKVSGIIKNHNAILFKNSKVPTDIDERNEYITNLDENTNDKLEDFEIEIMGLIDELEEKLNLFLKQEKLIEN